MVKNIEDENRFAGVPCIYVKCEIRVISTFKLLRKIVEGIEQNEHLPTAALRG